MLWWPAAAGVAALLQILSNRHANRILHLERIERQADLYGSLFSKLLCSRHMYIEFARLEGYQYPQDFLTLVDAVESNPDSPTAKRYRCFMTDVLGPIQLQIIELIADNESLLQSEDDDSLYHQLLEYLLMASSYKVIFARWKLSDYSMHFSHRRFPPELIDTLRVEIIKIKDAQRRLLGKKAKHSIKLYAPDYPPDTATVEEVK